MLDGRCLPTNHEKRDTSPHLVVEGAITPRDLDDYQPHQISKKLAVWARLRGLRTVGRLVPEVRRLRIEALAREAGRAENPRQARGTRRHAREGRSGEPTPRSV